jgi:tripartite-type tricarboxylate transporter receptor subunit TctC
MSAAFVGSNPLMKNLLISSAIYLICTSVCPRVADATELSPDARQTKIIVPYATGGAVDAIARSLSMQLEPILGQKFIVENRAGGSTVIGTSAVVNSQADGRTLLLVSLAIATNQSFIKNIPYNVLTDLRGISLIGSSPLILTINTSLPIKDVKSLIKYAAEYPGKLNYSTAGLGTTTHLAGELLKATAQVDISPVPYKGSGAAMTDLLSGRIQMAFISRAAIQPYLPSGKLRAIASTGLKRNPQDLSLPTMAELIPNFYVDLWTILLAPQKTPDRTVQNINDAVRVALKTAQLNEEFGRIGQEPTGSSPLEADSFLRSETTKWSTIMKSAKISVE